VPRREENRDWLQARIAEAASVSIELVNGLWHSYGSPGPNSLLRPQDVDSVRQDEIRTLQSVLVNGEVLGRLIDSRHFHALYQLVFDPGDHNPQGVGDVPAWTWLGSVLLDALRRQNEVVASGIASLIYERESSVSRRPLVVNRDVLFAFFPDDAEEVVERMSELANRIENTEQLDLVRAIVESSRVALQERNLDAETE
jgi:hypothetical protein